MLQQKCVCPVVFGAVANQLSDSALLRRGTPDLPTASILLIFTAILVLSWLGIVLRVGLLQWRKYKTVSPRIDMRALRAWLFGSSLSETEVRVHKLFRKLRHERLTESVFPAMAIVVTPIAIFYSSTWGIFCLVRPSSVYWRIVAGATLELFFGASFCIIGTFAGKRVPLWVFDACFSLVYVASGAHAGFVITDYEFLKSLLESTHLQVVIALFLSNPWLTLAMNVLIMVWQMSALFRGAVDPGTFPASVVIVLAVNQAVSMCAYQVLQAEARARVAEIEASRNEATTTNLLSILCDAVVHLRSNCTLRSACDRLNAMLCRSRSPNAEEQRFHQYLAEEDQPRFDEFLKNQAGGNRAGALPVQLVDSMGGKVPAHIYHISWLDADDELSHILGIQEAHGREYATPEAASSDPMAISRQRPEIDQVSTRTLQSEGALSFWGQGAEGDVHCVVETTVALEVTRESDECRSTFGLSLDPDALLSRVGEPEKFLAWLTMLALQKATSETSRVIPEKLDGSLKILGAGSDGVKYKADVQARVLEADLDSAGQLYASTLLKLQPKRRKRDTTQTMVKDTLRRVRERGGRLQTSQAQETTEDLGMSVSSEHARGEGTREAGLETEHEARIHL